MESIHVNYDELPQMASDQNSSDPAPKCQTMALEHDSLSPGRKCQENVSHGDKTVTTLNELDLLLTPMFDELLNVNHTTPEQSCQVQSHESTVTSNENINQAKLNAENDQVADDEFINVFSTPVQDRGETSNRHVDSSNMRTFYQRYPSEHRWTKDHPLEQVIGNPSQSVRTRRQLESDAKMCMFALTELVDSPLCTNVINLKWLWKNKRDEENTVIRNKSRLVAKGYAQKEGVDIENLSHPLLDGIIFGSTNPRYSTLFSNLMKSRFEMSMMGEMTFFLGLQVNQSPSGIFINQSNYVNEILKKYGLNTCDIIGTLMDIKDKLDLDQIGTPFDAMNS
nr:hypothetical protein [Tanacetum cinerariifolium]